MMRNVVVFCALFGLIAAVTPTEHFNTNHAWWTQNDAVESKASGYRRTCFMGVYDNDCSAIGTWNRMRSFALPTNIITEYSNTVTTYTLCRQTYLGRFYHRFVLGSCPSGWSVDTTVNLITSTSVWPTSFTESSTTWTRRDFAVFNTPQGPTGKSHLIIPFYDSAAYPDSYSLAFTFSAYQ